ncbi:hypothetical protein, partial [Pseudogemmobacter sonorensis]|uniref:hypothetical protein n=1 Tax=Pseudogemmobacter sonorensis TaxID=2989681 RepID=UPI0036BB7AF4
APLGDLSDRVTLEVVAEKACAHHGLLASKLAKKAAKKHGAIKIGLHGFAIRIEALKSLKMAVNAPGLFTVENQRLMSSV